MNEEYEPPWGDPLAEHDRPWHTHHAWDNREVADEQPNSPMMVGEPPSSGNPSRDAEDHGGFYIFPTDIYDPWNGMTNFYEDGYHDSRRTKEHVDWYTNRAATSDHEAADGT